MKKISQILKESKTPQITGQLIGYKYDEIVGKCALGVLACESGNPRLSLDPDYSWMRQVAITKYILLEYDIPTEYINDDMQVIPNLMVVNISDNEKHIYWSWKEFVRLENIILIMNDNLKMSLKEIGEFLEVTFDL